MSLSWADISELYHNGCGNSDFSFKERFTHITEAYRGICAVLEVPELYIPNATVSTVANQDWVEMDPDVYSLVSVNLKDTGLKLTPEPGGMRGRMRYYESDQVRPPISGSVSFYVRKGNRLYLRDTPDAIMTLIVAFRMHPPEITASTTLTEHPITPPQYDMALVRWAMGSYFSIHPPQVEAGVFDLQKGPALVEAAQEMLVEKRNPSAEEKLDTAHSTRQLGYDFGIGR
jgi:hypothetical protein